MSRPLLLVDTRSHQHCYFDCKMIVNTIWLLKISWIMLCVHINDTINKWEHIYHHTCWIIYSRYFCWHFFHNYDHYCLSGCAYIHLHARDDSDLNCYWIDRIQLDSTEPAMIGGLSDSWPTSSIFQVIFTILLALIITVYLRTMHFPLIWIHYLHMMELISKNDGLLTNIEVLEVIRENKRQSPIHVSNSSAQVELQNREYVENKVWKHYVDRPLTCYSI